MTEKTLKIRTIQKHDTEANWESSSIVPKKGEIIVYDPDENHAESRFKIGDGVKTPSALPFQNTSGPAGEPGTDGKDGVTFTPSVSSEGVISWTNDGGKPNPSSVNIKGPAGEPGSDGKPGADGKPGSDGANGVTFTPSVSSKGVISWTNDGGKTNPTPVNIKGADGKNGDPGSDGVGISTITAGTSTVSGDYTVTPITVTKTDTTTQTLNIKAKNGSDATIDTSKFARLDQTNNFEYDVNVLNGNCFVAYNKDGNSKTEYSSSGIIAKGGGSEVALTFPSEGGVIATTSKIPDTSEFAKLTDTNEFKEKNYFNQKTYLGSEREPVAELSFKDLTNEGEIKRKAYIRTYLDAGAEYNGLPTIDFVNTSGLSSRDSITLTKWDSTNKHYARSYFMNHVRQSDGNSYAIIAHSKLDPDTGYETEMYSASFPQKSGTVALTSDFVANPTLEGTEDALEGIELNGTKYVIKGGGGDVTAAGDNEFTGKNTFNASVAVNDEITALTLNTQILNVANGAGFSLGGVDLCEPTKGGALVTDNSTSNLKGDITFEGGFKIHPNGITNGEIRANIEDGNVTELILDANPSNKTAYSATSITRTGSYTNKGNTSLTTTTYELPTNDGGTYKIATTADNTFTKMNKFVEGIKIGTNTIDLDTETDGFELTKSGFLMYLKNGPWASINFPNYTAAGGTLALTSDIVANPTLAGTESNLTSLEIQGTKYKIPSGGSSSPIIASGIMGVGDQSYPDDGGTPTYGAYLCGNNEVEASYLLLVDPSNMGKQGKLGVTSLSKDRTLRLPDKDGFLATDDDTKLYEHIISFNAYLSSDNDVNGNGNLRVLSRSSTSLIDKTSADTRLDSFKTLLTNHGATVLARAYPIVFNSDGYTTMIWQGFYVNNNKIMAATGNMGSSDKGKEITVAGLLIAESVIEV